MLWMKFNFGFVSSFATHMLRLGERCFFFIDFSTLNVFGHENKMVGMQRPSIARRQCCNCVWRFQYVVVNLLPTVNNLIMQSIQRVHIFHSICCHGVCNRDRFSHRVLNITHILHINKWLSRAGTTWPLLLAYEKCYSYLVNINTNGCANKCGDKHMLRVNYHSPTTVFLKRSTIQ